MCKLCDDDAKYGHEPASAQSRAAEGGANLTDVLERTISAAEDYAANYDGDDRQDVETDVLNAFYAGVEFGKTLRSNMGIQGTPKAFPLE